MTIYSDKTLSQKIERTAALSNADFVESRAKLFPQSGAEWIEVAGVYAMFDAIDSPATQTFGLGLFDEITDAEMDTIEAFFKERNTPVVHEVSPMADPAIIPLLNKRGYQPIEFSSVMYQEIDPANFSAQPQNSQINTRLINEDEVDFFAGISTNGWSEEMPEYAEQMLEFSRVGASADGALSFIAECNSEPMATGTLYIYNGVAALAGASTIPSQRNKGAQTALLDARLRYAIENDCTITIISALPGSQSQRNAEKNGFRIAYTRTKWQLFSDQ
ncbi:MAG: GNAT family N-acetyltransferase [Acidobacteria bacterium]|nr:GNAT family N-acetyltransferase [Acidobacteriota bacterium]